MNLQSEISPDLWDTISSSYKAEIYKSAILDAMHFLSDAIREKADLDIDGEALIDKAFGGKNPLLKINKFQTQTEQDEHRGFFFSLKGLYAGIRNPRSHQKYEDSEQTANAIILFIDFLIKQLNLATPVFTIEKWLASALDLNFVLDHDYANLIVEEIPTSKLLDSLILLYRNKKNSNPEGIKLVISCLIQKLNQEEVTQFARIVSEELRDVIEDVEILAIIKILPANLWSKIDLIPKMRIENIVFSWISKAQVYQTLTGSIYDPEECYEEDENQEAKNFSHCLELILEFKSKNKIVKQLLRKTKYYPDINFIGKYFLGRLSKLVEDDHDVDILIETISDLYINSQPLVDNDDNYYEVYSYSCSNFKEDLLRNFHCLPDKWKNRIIIKIEERGVPKKIQHNFQELKSQIEIF